MTETAERVLYSYWRSSASYRVRIALNLKRLNHTIHSVNLLKNEQNSQWYRDINPQGLIPTLIEVIPDPITGRPLIISQSLAIIDYLEEAYPRAILLPDTCFLASRAHVRQMAQIIACDVHPLQNPRSLQEMRMRGYSLDADAWCCRWIAEGFATYEGMTRFYGDGFSFGDKPTLADCCLIPQVYNAKRFGCDLEPYPNIRRIYENCMQMEAFQKAAPENQPDAPK
ncbi:maleylacetoacetate isomerase [Candidatus Kaiserbacteria bacterium]|nr:maleylacetoacetate isomerase [Candidatus Kaiserbacteria bacterium]